MFEEQFCCSVENNVSPSTPIWPAEVIAPTQVRLRTARGALPRRSRPILAALTTDTLWIQETGQLRHIPLVAVAGVEVRQKGKALALAFHPTLEAEVLTLTFASTAEGQRWHDKLEACRQALAPTEPRIDRRIPENVALVRQQQPKVAVVELGRVEFTDRPGEAAERGLQLRAAMRGADAVLGLQRQRDPDQGWGGRQLSGLAVSVEDPVARQRLRRRWYAEEISRLVSRTVCLLAIQAVLLYLGGILGTGSPGLSEATEEAPLQSLAASGLGLALVSAWPLVLLVLLWVLRWPQLLRPLALAILAATTARGLLVILVHLLAVRFAEAELSARGIWLLVDPVNWGLIVAGLVLSTRAWRLSRGARHILPPEAQAVPMARWICARTLLGATALYALTLLAFTGEAQSSMGRRPPSLEPLSWSERQATWALNDADDCAERHDLEGAERSFGSALRQWEELTAKPAAPARCRLNLAHALHGLGWVRQEQGRLDEAEAYYTRVVQLGKEFAGDPYAAGQFQYTLTKVQQRLADLRQNRSIKLLEEKDEAGVRKYEQAAVKADNHAAEAEGLYREAIALWEEILPQATGTGYRKLAIRRLASSYLVLAELQKRRGKRSEAEAALRKSIEYGTKAADQNPDRPLVRHNLERARELLDELRDQALQEKIEKLCTAERYADAAEAYLHGIEEQEELLRSGKDTEEASRCLARRLSGCAWFLAHCPDPGIRDARAAVQRAQRATELQPHITRYWFTLAMVQYRNSDWRGSLASLEQFKAREGEFDAPSWLLAAMNFHRINKRDDARTALRRAAEWIEKRKRQAEGDALLRYQYETMRSDIELLQREAEKLIEGKDPADQGVG
jgi:tetratricopeptide (TPR) repeat protein